MGFRPQDARPIPFVDLLSWVFGRSDYKQANDIFVDADDDTHRITARKGYEYVRKLVSGLKAIGIKPGDPVCLHSSNHILYSVLYLGIVGAGGCFVGANPSYTFDELKHLLSISRAKYVIVEHEILHKALPAILASGIPSSQILDFATHNEVILEGLESWKTLLQHGESDWIKFDDERSAKSTIAALLSTSGTTGLPKAAAISHYAHVAASIMMCDSERKPYKISRLISLPQFHAFAAPLVHIAPFREGHTTYIMRRFEVEKYVRLIHQYQITETAVVPPMIASILNSKCQSNSLASLRWLWCAGAPLSDSLFQRMSEMLASEAILTQVWGMTEIGWISTLLYPERDTSNSVGRLLPNTEAKIMDPHGVEITRDDHEGEIYVRGPSIMNYYLDNPEATCAAFSSGWLKTGDVGYCKEGKWYIVDRVKDLIKVRAWQVSPAELENCLLSHPYVLDAAVVGIQAVDQESELPLAYVVLSDEGLASKVMEQELKDFVRGRLSSYKALAGGVRFVGSIRRNSSGKILRRLLREDAQRDEE